MITLGGVLRSTVRRCGVGVLVAALIGTAVSGPAAASVPAAPVLSQAVLSQAVLSQAVTTQAVSVAPGTALVRTPTGGLWALATKTNGQVFQIIKGSGNWTAPHDIGGPFRSGPAAVFQAAGNRLDVFAVFADGSLRTAGFSGGKWGQWAQIASGFSGGVAAVRTPAGEIHVTVIGTNAHVYQLVRASSGRWLPRQDLGGSFANSTSITYYPAANQFDVLATGTDGRVRHRIWHGSWGGWQAATVAKSFSGVASVRVGATLKVYAVNNNRAVYEFGRTSATWSTPRSLGGSVHGTPSVVATASQLRVVAIGTDGTLVEKIWQGAWSGWNKLPASGFPKIAAPAPPSRVTLAKTLLARWGGRVTGLAGAKSDLQVTAAGRAVTSCGRAVYLDPKMLTAIVKGTNKYQVFLNNMVTGHSCDSGYHPLGKAVDFNTVVDPATGRSTNWHSYSSGDNQALDAEFLSYAASAIVSGGGAGQVNCPGSAHAAVPSGMLRFSDYCNHQHLDSR